MNPQREREESLSIMRGILAVLAAWAATLAVAGVLTVVVALHPSWDGVMVGLFCLTAGVLVVSAR